MKSINIDLLFLGVQQGVLKMYLEQLEVVGHISLPDRPADELPQSPTRLPQSLAMLLPLPLRVLGSQVRACGSRRVFENSFLYWNTVIIL